MINGKAFTLKPKINPDPLSCKKAPQETEFLNPLFRSPATRNGFQ